MSKRIIAGSDEHIEQRKKQAEKLSKKRSLIDAIRDFIKSKP